MVKKNTVSVGYQFDHATDTLKNLQSNSQKATQATVKDFKIRGVAWVGQGVSEEYNVPKSRVKQDFKGAKGDSTNVGLQFSGRLLTAGRFKMKPKKRKPKNKPYRVSVEIVKGAPRNLPATTFLATLGETPQAFRREGKKRYPIQMVKTLSIPQMISSKRGAPRVEELVAENVQKRKDHHEERFFK